VPHHISQFAEQAEEKFLSVLSEFPTWRQIATWLI